MARWYISKLSSAHQRKAFACGESSLDAYLRERASQDVRRDLAACYVLTEAGSDDVVGYYTLSAASIRLSDLPAEVKRRSGTYSLVPAVLLGRLAVSVSAHGQGCGALLLADALKRTIDTGVGVKLVMVDALTEDAVRFYQHFGFQRLSDAEMRLFITTETVRGIYPGITPGATAQHGTHNANQATMHEPRAKGDPSMTTEGPQNQPSSTDQSHDEHDERAYIDRRVAEIFAPEDDDLQAALAALDANGMPHISISPLEGRLLQVLAAACGARKVLEIGALSGYSGIWLARALPKGGRLISLEVSEKHARVARESLKRAGLDDRAEVRVGPAEVSLGTLVPEAPFDLIFIDADKPGYPTYLDWALRLTRPGSVIVADNTIRRGLPLADPLPEDATADTRALAEYNRRVASDPHVLAVALPVDDGGTDGFTIAVVLGSFADAPSAETQA